MLLSIPEYPFAIGWYSGSILFLMWIGKNSLILRSEHRIRPLNQVFCCEVSPNDCTPSPLFEQPFNMYILYIVPNDCTLDAHLSNTTPRGRHALHIVLHVVLHIVLHTQACHCMCGTVQSTVQFRTALKEARTMARDSLDLEQRAN